MHTDPSSIRLQPVNDDDKSRIMFGALRRGVETLDLLAAVGRNTGSDSDHGYVFGHGLAAELLFCALGRGHGGSRKTSYGASAYVDALIYPLCYCIRHYVELSLKDAVKRTRQLRNEKPPPNRDHRLQRIWLQFAQTCLQDRRLPPIATVLKPLVDAVAAVDPTGQAFRYASSLKGDVHHIETAVIHLRSTEATFRALRKALDQLDSALDFLEREYFLGTFTSKLSRADLVEIAIAIKLAYDSKDNGWMKKVREQIKQQFELTNSEFDAADKLIEKHRFLSNISGVELPLNELTAETMYVLPWAIAAFPGDDLLSEEEWVGIAGVVSVMLPNASCEDYDWELQRISDEDKYIDKEHLGRKITQAPDRFLRALHLLGQPTLAAAFLQIWPEVGD